jgi:ketosteroid isomerase-like protein
MIPFKGMGKTTLNMWLMSSTKKAHPHPKRRSVMLRFRVCVPLIILVAMVAIACQPKGPAALTDADKAAIKKTADQGLAMLTAPTKDWAGFIKFLYTEDAMILPPNAPAVQGQEAIIAFVQKLFPPVFDYKQQLVEIAGFGNFAYDLETWSMTITPPEGQAATDTGRLIWIWQKQANGSWKLWREMWSSDLPAPGSTAPSTQ